MNRSLTYATQNVPDTIRAPGDKLQPPRMDSRELLRGQRELVITHGDEQYRLRRTRQDKLILTK